MCVNQKHRREYYDSEKKYCNGDYPFDYNLWLMLTNLKIPCIFYETTGLLCPGCGITRMIMAVLRLDFSAAFAYNGAMFFVLPALGIVYILETYRYIKTGNTDSTVFSKIVLALCCVVLLFFSIYRNL